MLKIIEIMQKFKKNDAKQKKSKYVLSWAELNQREDWFMVEYDGTEVALGMVNHREELSTMYNLQLLNENRFADAIKIAATECSHRYATNVNIDISDVHCAVVGPNGEKIIVPIPDIERRLQEEPEFRAIFTLPDIAPEYVVR